MFESKLERKVEGLEKTVNSLIGEMSIFLRRLETNQHDLSRRMRNLEHSISPYTSTGARIESNRIETDQLHRRSQEILQERINNSPNEWIHHHIGPEGFPRSEENQREREEWDD